MKVTVFTSSPNKDGLTADLGRSAQKGAIEAGVEVEVIDLNAVNVGRCHAYGNGWGRWTF